MRERGRRARGGVIAVALLFAQIGAVTSGVSPAAGASSFVSRSGTTLELDGRPFAFTGLNIYNANSRGACWYDLADGSGLDDALAAIGPGHAVMRAWFFQPLAQTGGLRDWSAFDHTLAVAAAHGVKVIATLSDEWGECGDGGVNHAKTKSWFQTGYATQTDPGLLVPYREWVQEVVTRYRNDPRIAFWELMNEPEIRYVDQSGNDLPCPSGSEPADILSAWATDVSGLVKSVDPNHLVSLGLLGTGQCGAQGAQYETVESIPTVDLCSYHDYDAAHALPGDSFNGLQMRIHQCDALNKPVYVGEAGIVPQDAGGTLAGRAARFGAKVDAEFGAGVRGLLAWAWDSGGSTLGDYDIGPGDPSLAALSADLAAPAAPSAVSGNGRVTLRWQAPATNGGPSITGYVVTPYRSGIAQPAHAFSSTATTEPITNLANGKTYSFRVSARNAVAVGSQSLATAAVTVGAPTGPAAVTVTPGNASATLHWKAPASVNGSPITGYVVTPYRAGVAQPAHRFGKRARSGSLSGLANGRRYTFTVAAGNARGTGMRSTTSAVTIGTPVVPTAVVATRGVKRAAVRWRAPTTGNGAPITGYVVTPFVGGVARTPAVFAPVATAETITGLVSGERYTFEVAARNSRGTGPRSVASNAVTPA